MSRGTHPCSVDGCPNLAAYEVSCPHTNQARAPSLTVYRPHEPAHVV